MIVIKCPNCGNYKLVELTTDQVALDCGNDCYCNNCDEYFDSKFDAELEEIEE